MCKGAGICVRGLVYVCHLYGGPFAKLNLGGFTQ